MADTVNKRYINILDLDLISISGVNAPATPATNGSPHIQLKLVARQHVAIVPTPPTQTPANKCGPNELILNFLIVKIF
jgi:hypothetical protein